MRGIAGYVVLIVLVVVAIAAAGTLGYAYGQGAVMPIPVTPRVFSGQDVGFRMDARKGKTPTGTLIIRLNDEWVEVEFSSGIKLITK